jgi:hypothetical protein
MRYIDKEEYDQARQLLPDPNRSELDTIVIELNQPSPNNKQTQSSIYFTKVLFCDSPRIPEKEYKWILDRKFNLRG